MRSQQYAKTVGSYLRRRRLESGATLDQTVQAGRRFGAGWSLSSVQAIEAGSGAPTLPNLIVIALVIGDLTGEPISLADLFRDGEKFAPPNERDDEGVTADWLRAVLSGAVVQLSSPRHRVDEIERRAPWSTFSEDTMLEDEIQARLSARGAHPLTRAEREGQFEAMLEESQDPERYRDRGNATPSLAVKRAAKKLGIAPLEVERRAITLWGGRFDSELWSRAGRESSPQARGRVTRLLVEEIRDSLGER